MKPRNQLLIVGLFLLMSLFFLSAEAYCCCEDPRAVMSVSPNPVCVGCLVSFDATTSYDPDCSSCSSCGDTSMLKGIREFAWDWTNNDSNDHTESPGDGQASYTYSAAGTYTCRLTVHDDDDDCCCSGEDCNDKSASTTVTLRVVKVNKVVDSATGTDEGPLYTCLGGSIGLKAIAYPSGSFPSGAPNWSIVSQPTDANASLTPSSGSDTTTLGNLTKAGNYTVKARCGSSDSGDNITVKVIEVASLTPNEGTEFDDSDGDPNTKSYVLCCATSGTVTVTATPNPSVAEAELPGCWSLTGGTGTGKLSRTVDKTTAGMTVITCTSGSSSKTTKVYIFEVVQTNDLWWFDGVSPGGGYYTQTVLTANGTTVGEFKWDVSAGTSKVDLNNGGSDSDSITATNDNNVTIKSTAASSEAATVTKDVAIQFRYQGVLVKTFETVVFAPDHLVHLGDIDSAAGAGWLSKIYYRIENQFNQTLPHNVPINEKFMTGETSDWPGGDNWVRGPETGDTVPPASWNDYFQRSTPACTIPSLQNPQTPLGNQKVDHWDGDWLVGSATPGNGRVVKGVIWQTYRDHGRHE